MAAVQQTNLFSDDNLQEYNVENSLLEFLEFVLERTVELSEQVACGNDTEINDRFESLLEVLDNTVKMLRSIADDLAPREDKSDWESLAAAFYAIFVTFHQQIREKARRPTTVTQGECGVDRQQTPGRPPFQIEADVLEDLRGMGFTWTKIAQMFGVSRWTLYRRVREFNLQDMTSFSSMADSQLDEIIREYLREHGSTTGQTYIAGYIRSLGLRIQRRRIRESMARVDPRNTALRWACVVRRRKYSVPWPNSLWHLDGHHSLIRWRMVIHGCIDGFSRRIMFLKCSNNNLSQTVLDLFLHAIYQDNGLWPSRIRVDHGVENVLVCDAIVAARGEGRASFIAGSSTRNQRIERLWRDVFQCVCHIHYYTFYGMEDTGLLNIENPIDMLALHITFLPRINLALSEFMETFNHHGLRTENNWSPYQLWLNGMLNPDNPLASGLLDDEVDPELHEFYGFDPEAPIPLEESSNNVVVPPIILPGDETDSVYAQCHRS